MPGRAPIPMPAIGVGGVGVALVETFKVGVSVILFDLLMFPMKLVDYVRCRS